ncbi:MAG: ATPase, T2SS/T4P/T4SS family [Acidobacteriota bacterium]
MKMLRKEKLGEILIARRAISEDDLKEALTVQGSNKRPLGEILVELGILSEKKLRENISAQLGIPFLDLTEKFVDPEVARSVAGKFCKDNRVLPIYRLHNKLIVAMVDPTDLEAIDATQFLTGYKIDPVLVTAEDFQKTLDRFHTVSSGSEYGETIKDLEAAEMEVMDKVEQDQVDLSESTDQTPVIKLVNLILKQALSEGASDIHLESKENNLRVRNRIDGALIDRDPIPKLYKNAVVSRVKVLSKLDIAEKRLPMDGAFTVMFEGRRIDFRVSTFPSVTGEKVVMRILDKANTQIPIEQIGFPDEMEKQIKSVVSKPDGIFLVTGPTGSGKSTTLYTLLRFLDDPESNIVTMEDPVEYNLETITQGQVNPKIEFTFASGLRSILRQDPDIVMVGEIRDLETARIAVQASLTGHLVLSTLHTNSSTEAISRMLDMGLEPFMITAAIRGVLAQRLVKRVCNDCKTAYQPPQELLNTLKLKFAGKVPNFYKGAGCATCRGKGYKGRMGVYEYFMMTEEVGRLIMANAGPIEIRNQALKEGMVTLRRDGIQKVIQGHTSIEEVLAITS